MNHSKTFIRDDGTKTTIVVKFSTESYSDQVRWGEDVRVVPPRKRNEIRPLDLLTDNYAFRRAEGEERKRMWDEERRKLVSDEELLSVKLELWEKLKPI